MPLLAPVIHIIGFSFSAELQWERHLLTALCHDFPVKPPACSPLYTFHACRHIIVLISSVCWQMPWIKMFPEFKIKKWVFICFWCTLLSKFNAILKGVTGDTWQWPIMQGVQSTNAALALYLNAFRWCVWRVSIHRIVKNGCTFSPFGIDNWMSIILS